MGLHADLIAIGVRWLRSKGCDVILAEPWTPRGERPDVIGWKRDGSGSILIEAKATRSDLLTERSAKHGSRKPFRRGAAAGAERFYLAPHGVMPMALLDEFGWGLLVPQGRLVRVERWSAAFEVNYQTELQILVRAASDPKYGKQRPLQVAFQFAATHD